MASVAAAAREREIQEPVATVPTVLKKTDPGRGAAGGGGAGGGGAYVAAKVVGEPEQLNAKELGKTKAKSEREKLEESIREDPPDPMPEISSGSFAAILMGISATDAPSVGDSVQLRDCKTIMKALVHAGVHIVTGGPIMEVKDIGHALSEEIERMRLSTTRYGGIILYLSVPGTTSILHGYGGVCATSVLELQAILGKCSMFTGLPKILLVEAEGQGTPDKGLAKTRELYFSKQRLKPVPCVPDACTKKYDPETTLSAHTNFIIAYSVTGDFRAFSHVRTSCWTGQLASNFTRAVDTGEDVRIMDVLKQALRDVAMRVKLIRRFGKKRRLRLTQCPCIYSTMQHDPILRTSKSRASPIGPDYKSRASGPGESKEDRTRGPEDMAVAVAMDIAISSVPGPAGYRKIGGMRSPVLCIGNRQSGRRDTEGGADKAREGYRKDVELVSSGFERLGCNVIVRFNVDSIEETLRSALKELEEPDSFVLYLSAGGGQGYCFNNAGKRESISRLRHILQGCAALAGCPKILLFDVPGGAKLDVGMFPGHTQVFEAMEEEADCVPVDGKVLVPRGSAPIPVVGDTLEAYACVPGYDSLSSSDGSYWTMTFVEYLTRGRTDDFLELLEWTNSFVARYKPVEDWRDGKHVRAICMQPVLRHTLRHPLKIVRP